MTFLLVIIVILRIITLTLLGIAALIVLLLWLGIPYRAEITSRLNEEFKATFRASWLCGLLVISYDSANKAGLVIRLAGFRLKRKSKSAVKEAVSDTVKATVADTVEEAATEEMHETAKTPRIKKTKKKRDENPKAPDAPKKQGIFARINAFISENDISHLLHLCIELLKRLVRGLGFRRADIDVLFGTGDPADTGQLLGLVAIIQGITRLPGRYHADFDRVTLVARASLTGKTNLWRLLYPLGVFILQPPVWKLISDARKGKAKEEKN